MDKREKETEITLLKEKFAKANAAIVSEYRGMTVSEITNLRKALRSASAEMRVSKNTLAKIAAKGTPIEALQEHLTGPTAIILSYKDQAAVAKALVDFTKDQEKLKIKGGVLGTTLLDAKGIKTLAELPSLDILRGKIIGLINAPATKIARILSTPGTQVAQVLKAYSEKK